MTDIGTHRSKLIEHFRGFAESRREEIAKKWGCARTEPEALTRFVFESPELIREAVKREILDDEEAYRLMEELAFDHDLLIDIGWAGRKARRKLAAMGLLSTSASDAATGEGEMPAALAVVVSPYLRNLRTTLPTLLGAADEEHVERVVGSYGIVGTTQMERILTVSEWLADPERAEDLQHMLPSPEHLGAAMMALELGGVCFWQEVFGHDLHRKSAEADNVVALMRSDERAFERQLADTLMDFGIVFRIEEPGKEPVAVVPEELWSSLWHTGRTWLMDWTAAAMEDATDGGVRRSTAEAGEVDLQAALKWFACEADRGTVRMNAGVVADATLERFVDVGGHDARFWAQRLDVAVELSALRVRRSGAVVEDPTFRRVLDLPRSGFVRQVLYDWCTGYAGSAADARLPTSFALDDSWRREVVKFLRKRGEFVPLWMEHTGVDQETTGSGYIRNAGDSEPERLLMEIGLTNGLVWSAKLVWLDLLSFLEDDLWYPTTTIAELLQIASGLSTFAQLIHVLEQPNMGYYLPVQRASFIGDTFQTPEFEAWLVELVEHLLGPLGIAKLSDDGTSLWLHTANLRVESPPGLPDDQRELLLREIFQDPSLEFRVPRAAPGVLHRVDSAGDEGSIDLDLPLEVVREWLGERPIASFDGRRLHVD